MTRELANEDGWPQVVIRNTNPETPLDERKVKVHCDCEDSELVIGGIRANTVYVPECMICRNRQGEFI